MKLCTYGGPGATSGAGLHCYLKCRNTSLIQLMAMSEIVGQGVSVSNTLEAKLYIGQSPVRIRGRRFYSGAGAPALEIVGHESVRSSTLQDRP